MAAQDYASVVKTNFADIKGLLQDETGWTKIAEDQGCVIFEKPMQGQPLNCYKAVGDVSAPPKKVLDVIWGAREDTWKKVDDSLEKWEIVEEVDENTSILSQVNKVQWPLWSRDLSMVRAKVEEGPLSMVLFKSVDHPKIPRQDDKYVRANVIYSAYVFEPTAADAEKTKVTRILLVDPAGNIPTTFVNMSAKKTNSSILFLRNYLQGK
eukprot:TRINITY_DN11536_c0_g1_i1.p2 TRINITY_DN11536_c0_g1~~TRINITY_DN11536_c0_g1_i1.p2  ORF type:complete len:219 (-),score=57.81 TRINITY_DN11536_c0_g1_i1:64-690(-)